jgi:iron-sulfur cluster repair protein YtfE (RIC family)
MVEVTHRLRKDHDAVRELFAGFEQAHEGGDEARMTELAATVCRELDVHAEVEEQIFYPAVRERGGEDLAETIAEAFEEHHVVKVLIGEIRELETSDDAFAAKVTVLRELVEHHAGEEETELFPQVQAMFDKVELLGLGRRIEEREASLEGELEAQDEVLDLEAMSKADLYEKAKEQDIDGRSSMTKQELVEAIRSH